VPRSAEDFILSWETIGATRITENFLFGGVVDPTEGELQALLTTEPSLIPPVPEPTSICPRVWCLAQAQVSSA
jgi:hypothetical protein